MSKSTSCTKNWTLTRENNKNSSTFLLRETRTTWTWAPRSISTRPRRWTFSKSTKMRSMSAFLGTNQDSNFCKRLSSNCKIKSTIIGSRWRQDGTNALRKSLTNFKSPRNACRTSRCATMQWLNSRRNLPPSRPRWWKPSGYSIQWRICQLLWRDSCLHWFISRFAKDWERLSERLCLRKS